MTVIIPSRSSGNISHNIRSQQAQKNTSKRMTTQTARSKAATDPFSPTVTSPGSASWICFSTAADCFCWSSLSSNTVWFVVVSK